MMRASKQQQCAIYVRVSTDDQVTNNQLFPVRDLARLHGFLEAFEYVEVGSAAKARPVFDQMMDDARRRKFQVLAVWALDRLGRSLVYNVQTVLDLERYGVQIISVRDPWIAEAGPHRSLLVSVLSWVAEQERIHLVERTVAGMARARAQGKHLGRPKSVVDEWTFQRLLSEGATVERMATLLGVSSGTIKRIKRGHKKQAPQAPEITRPE